MSFQTNNSKATFTVAFSNNFRNVKLIINQISNVSDSRDIQSADKKNYYTQLSAHISHIECDACNSVQSLVVYLLSQQLKKMWSITGFGKRTWRNVSGSLSNMQAQHCNSAYSDLRSERISLWPFTKDFRGRWQLNESVNLFLWWLELQQVL